MIDQLLIDAIGDALEAELSGVFVGRQHTAEELALPAVLLKIESESVVGGPLYRGTIEAVVISQSSESTTAQHATLCQEVDTVFRSLSISSPSVALYGIVATTASPDVDGGQFRTSLNYITGYGPTT